MPKGTVVAWYAQKLITNNIKLNEIFSYLKKSIPTSPLQLKYVFL